MGSPEPTPTLGVTELLGRLQTAVADAFPTPVWVGGEVSGLRRTPRGAVFFDLVDPDDADKSVRVAARGIVMREVDLAFDRAGVGSVRAGIQVRISGTVSLSARGIVTISLLDVDPAFTVGKLALDREELLRRLAADGSLQANKALLLPLVPLRLGLVTSRGSAAHADFLDQLKRSGFRFRVATAHASMQGENAPAQIARAVERASAASVDLVAVVRGGGAKLDLQAFDTEVVARAVARSPVPVVTGIGHEIDQSVADLAAAVTVKTPTAAAEWIVGRVAAYAETIDRARNFIREQARTAYRDAGTALGTLAAGVGMARRAVSSEAERLDTLSDGIRDAARRGLETRGKDLESLAETLLAVGIEPTLRRGFGLVSRHDGSPVTRAAQLAAGDRVRVRFADDSVDMRVEEET